MQTATDLAGGFSIGGVLLRSAGHGLAVWAPTDAGHNDLGTIPKQSLDASRYSIAPSIVVNHDQGAATAVVGFDDRREVGRVRVMRLRTGDTPLIRTVALTGAGQAPSPCVPSAGTEDRWGWFTSELGSDLRTGRTLLRLASGSKRSVAQTLNQPYERCFAVSGGYLLTHDTGAPDVNATGATWLDHGGQVLRQVRGTATDARHHTSVSPVTASVLLPAGNGFDLIDRGGAVRHVTADDALLAPTGELWTVRGDRVRREPR